MTTDRDASHPDPGATPSQSAADWDDRYRGSERLWTANVNPSLITEVDGLEPSTALDVGAGEGADARWLADRGWRVTAVDISQVAVDRARALDPRSDITWVRADLTADELPGRDYGLVTAHYLPIRIADIAVAQRLVGAVGVGGTLLLVAHALEGVRTHGFDPADYVQPADVAALLGDDWTVVTDEIRPRGIPAGGGHHVDDVILRARRG
ncbi:class I SAM-dependent methyltransferase [Gordonia sinesedis]